VEDGPAQGSVCSLDTGLLVHIHPDEQVPIFDERLPDAFEDVSQVQRMDSVQAVEGVDGAEPVVIINDLVDHRVPTLGRVETQLNDLKGNSPR
jgi:hypothetical protein